MILSISCDVHSRSGRTFRMGSVLDEWLTPFVFDEVDRCGVQNGRRLGVTIGLSPTLRKIPYCIP